MTLHSRSGFLRLCLWLYPFATGAVAINLFLLFLMLQAVGVPAMPPLVALVLSVPLGLPATWAAARWVRGLIDEAGRRPGDRGASRH
jgi:hypothetical protein